MAFYSPRNIGPADQVLFDADGNAVGIQAAGSSSQPVLGFSPTKHAAIDALVSGASIADLIEPWCIAHRGAGAMLAPDSTLEAYALGITWGTGIIDGGDWYAVADGGVFDFHDATLDTKTDQTGATTAATSAQMARILIDSSVWFGGGWPDTRGAMTPEIFFGTLRGRTCFAPEPKNLGAANYLANYLPTLALQRQCLINAFTDTLLQPFIDQKFPYLFRNLTPGAEHSGFNTARAQELLDKGIRYLGILATDANAGTAAATAIAAGMKVIVGTVNRQHRRLTWDPRGVSGYVSDDPVYMMGRSDVYRRITAPFGSGTFYHGHLQKNELTTISTADNRGSFAAGRLVLNTTNSANNWILQGWCSGFEKPASYTHNATIKFTTIPTDRSRWAGIAMCLTDDQAYADAAPTSAFDGSLTYGGYQIWIRPSATAGGGAAGNINIAKKLNGGQVGATQTANLSGEIAAGSSVALAIAVTPTAITVTVSGAVTGTVTLTDASLVPATSPFRGQYVFYGHSSDWNTNSAVLEFGPCTES